MPTAVSLNAMSFPKKPSQWLSIAGIAEMRCQNARMPLPSMM
jgi:hypothetical protein